jgi:drug/metabolite transporter (DMT)-like permease
MNPDNPSRGIALIVMSLAVASVMDGLSKTLAAHGFHPLQIAWARFLFITLFLMVPVAAKSFHPLRTGRLGLQVVRGLGMFGSSLFFITSLSLLPIADSTALAFVLPFFVTALSIPLLGERVGIRRWLAVAAGFVGVLIIARPGGGGYGAAALFPVASAMCGAVGFIATRMLRNTEPVLTTLTLSALIGLVATSATVPFVWRAPDGQELALMFVIGALSGVSQLLLILAFQNAQPSILAPFVYTQMIWATGVGFFMFHTLPDATTLAGAAIIIAGGIYTWHRERRLHRAQSAQASATLR